MEVECYGSEAVMVMMRSLDVKTELVVHDTNEGCCHSLGRLVEG